MNTGQIRGRGWLPLVLSWLLVLPVGEVSNSVVLAQTPATTVFFDDFTGTSLHPAWTIINNDANSWALVNGNYLLMVLNDERNNFCYNGTVPDRYEFVVKVVPLQRLDAGYLSQGTFEGNYEIFYIGIFDATDKGGEMTSSASGSNNVWVFKKIVGGQVYRFWNVDPHPNMSEYYMKISRPDSIQAYKHTPAL